MGNQDHLDILKQGVEIWNQWREEHPDIVPGLSGTYLYKAKLNGANLSGADFKEANLSEADLREALLMGVNFREANLNGANLSRADLSESKFYNADLNGANLSGADLSEAELIGARLTEADLSGANLSGAALMEALLFGADFSDADLSGAALSQVDFSLADVERGNLSGANLRDAKLSGTDLSHANLYRATLTRAVLVETNLENAILTNCHIYGIAAWNVKLRGARQNDLVITRDDEPTIMVDNLKVAQFIYLLLNNEEIREVIDTITSKVVLILGRFTDERKKVLDAIRDELRKKNYLPVLFDFEKPSSRDLTETVSTLAHLARFIIVDLADPSSVPHEVATIIPQTVVPVQPLLTLQPLIIDGKAIERHEYAMFADLRKRYHWVLPTFRYQDTADLLPSLQNYIIHPAELKAQELEMR